MAKWRKNMATKEVKQNLEQCSAVAVEGEPIAVAILEQRKRKLSTGYLQNSDLQRPKTKRIDKAAMCGVHSRAIDAVVCWRSITAKCTEQGETRQPASDNSNACSAACEWWGAGGVRREWFRDPKLSDVFRSRVDWDCFVIPSQDKPQRL
ncbi:hypothetical protein WN943_001298 [Citrus x changshan-huyou]